MRFADRIAHGRLVPVVCAIGAQATAAPVPLVQLARASTVTAAAFTRCGATTPPALSAERVSVWLLYDTDTIWSVESMNDVAGSQPYRAWNAALPVLPVAPEACQML